MQRNEKSAGTEGEEIAVQFLKDKNYEIIDINFRLGNKGEIDIIAIDPDGYLVFTEVKLRISLKYGEPEYAVTRGKQSQLKKIAAAYLFVKGIYEHPCRFDVICIMKLPGENPDIKHYINAFQ